MNKLHSAIRDMKAIKAATILATSFTPSKAPCAAASKRLLAVLCTSIFTFPLVFGTPVSGYNNLSNHVNSKNIYIYQTLTLQ